MDRPRTAGLCRLRSLLTLAAGEIAGDEHHLLVSQAALDHAAGVVPGQPFASLFLLPGIGETLRVNGRVAEVAGGQVRVRVTECYGHCAKALIRSDFWSALPAETPAGLPAFAAATRFIALATTDAGGMADISPKGDPAGCMVQLDGDTLLFADRPGNRRLDSFRNMLDHPRVSLALLVPGVSMFALAEGTATLSTEPALLQRFTVQGKVPLVVTTVALDRVDLQSSPALAHAALWPVDPVRGIDPAQLFVEHIRRNRTVGISARLARATLAVPGADRLVRKGLDKDYSDNLY